MFSPRHADRFLWPRRQQVQSVRLTISPVEVLRLVHPLRSSPHWRCVEVSPKVKLDANYQCRALHKRNLTDVSPGAVRNTVRWYGQLLSHGADSPLGKKRWGSGYCLAVGSSLEPLDWDVVMENELCSSWFGEMTALAGSPGYLGLWVVHDPLMPRLRAVACECLWSLVLQGVWALNHLMFCWPGDKQSGTLGADELRNRHLVVW